ncbi:hypothetical protein CFOL_v3_05650 [Cephalotus follicularis]|uniref:Uncharacterized protein n=1 Tax=Cephalotus follicularis TaxID=3775 RepID=A0A1Q3B281_CEPFO|nr:hypothetical protein CFOL_v3_05650 [Cephalotus follicularis]
MFPYVAFGHMIPYLLSNKLAHILEHPSVGCFVSHCWVWFNVVVFG